MLRKVLFIILLVLPLKNVLCQSNYDTIKVNSEIIYLGVLETKKGSWPESSHQAKQNSTSKKIVRILFYRSEGEWKSLENEIGNSKIYPSNINWFIAFNGKQIGTLRSSFTPLRFKDAEWTYPRDAYHKTENKNLPTIGEPTKDFTGWSMEMQPRPLVVVSKPNCTDPENWKPFSPNLENMKTIYPVYKKYISRYLDAETIDISEMTYLKSYQSNKFEKLIQVGHIKKNENEEYTSYPIWIYLSNSGEIKNITNIIDSEFSQDDFGDDDFSTSFVVDAGDYDSNGTSEVIFWSKRYNGDGYVLFFNEFENMIDFTWSYH